MAIMKIKNDAGEWVSGAPVNFLHQFKFEFVEPIDMNGSNGRKYLDLSPYVQKNSDFMLIMRPDYTTGRVPTVYIHSDGQIRQFNTSSVSGDVNILDTVFEDNNAFDEEDFVYDEETRIMQYKYKPSNISGSDAGMGFNKTLLIYAG